MVKNPSAMRETWVPALGQEDPWRKDRLPTLVFLGFPGGSAGKESTCNSGNLGSIPRLGKSPEKKRLPIPVFWPGEFHGLHSPRGHKESDMTEQLHFHFQACKKNNSNRKTPTIYVFMNKQRKKRLGTNRLKC